MKKTRIRRVLSLMGTGLFALASSACGPTPSDHSEQKVFGGTQVKNGTWLSTVAIVDKYWGMNCSGTAIDPYVVITAAHCVQGKTAASTLVYVGEGKNGGSVTAQYETEKVLYSPKYSRWDDGNDIAFIKLKKPLDLDRSAYVKVLLDKAEMKELLAIGAPAHIVGFGNNDQGGFGVKFEVATKVVPSISLSHDNKTEIAIGGDGKDSCNGDSGGPVYGKLKNGEWRVYGVTSRGGACGTGGIYGLIHANICWVEKESGVDLKLPEGYCAEAAPADPVENGDDEGEDQTPTNGNDTNADGNAPTSP